MLWVQKRVPLGTCAPWAKVFRLEINTTCRKRDTPASEMAVETSVISASRWPLSAAVLASHSTLAVITGSRWMARISTL